MKVTLVDSENRALGVRVDETNPNHHLWLNNGTWFVHSTAYPTPVIAERVRASLQTKDVVVARQRRDELFRRLSEPAPALAA